jgi:hypothetical protein
MEKKHYIMIIAILSLLLITSFVNNTITNNAVFNVDSVDLKVNERPKPLLFKGYNSSADFPNTDCATINYVGNFSPDFLGINLSNPPQYMVIFESNVLEGLRIVYDIDSKTLQAGLPEMQSSKINLFDDSKMHKVSYTFCKASGIQKIYFDCKELVSGPFKGSNQVLATGFVSKDSVDYREVMVNGNLESFNSEVIPEFNEN